MNGADGDMSLGQQGRAGVARETGGDVELVAMSGGLPVGSPCITRDGDLLDDAKARTRGLPGEHSGIHDHVGRVVGVERGGKLVEKRLQETPAGSGKMQLGVAAQLGAATPAGSGERQRGVEMPAASGEMQLGVEAPAESAQDVRETPAGSGEMQLGGEMQLDAGSGEMQLGMEMPAASGEMQHLSCDVMGATEEISAQALIMSARIRQRMAAVEQERSGSGSDGHDADGGEIDRKSTSAVSTDLRDTGTNVVQYDGIVNADGMGVTNASAIAGSMAAWQMLLPQQVQDMLLVRDMMLIQRMVSDVALVRARARPQQLMQAAQWEQLHIDMSTGAATPLRVFGMAIGESCAVAAELVLHIEARATWMVERAQHATLLVLPIEERPAALRARGSFNDCDHMGDAVVTAACFELELEGNVAGRGQRLHESMGRMRHGDGATGATYDGGAGGMDTRAELVILTAAQSITAGDGIVAARGSATACSITEGYLAPPAQELDIGARISSIHDLPPEGGGVGVQWIWEDQPRPQRLGNRWQDGIKRGKRMETC